MYIKINNGINKKITDTVQSFRVNKEKRISWPFTTNKCINWILLSTKEYIDNSCYIIWSYIWVKLHICLLPATKKYRYDYQITELKKNNWTMSLRKKCTVFKYNQIFIVNNILQTNKQVVNCTDILKHDIMEKKTNIYVQWNSFMMGVT